MFSFSRSRNLTASFVLHNIRPFCFFFFCSMHHWKWIHMASTSQGQSSIPSWSSNHQSQLINLPSLPSIHPPVPKPMEQGRAPPTQTSRTMVQTRPKPRKTLRNRTSTELEITYTISTGVRWAIKFADTYFNYGDTVRSAPIPGPTRGRETSASGLAEGLGRGCRLIVDAH